jgi:hypothetical protein
MSEPHPAELDPVTEKPSYGQLSDTKLTQVIRAGGQHAYLAAGVIRRRHLPSGLSYARLCANGDVAAQQLADRAFALASGSVREGTAVNRPWRWRLLLNVEGEAANWAFGALRSELLPEFAAFVDSLQAESADPLRIDVALRERSAIRAAFERLSEHRQGILLGSLLEDEAPEEVAASMGIEVSDVDEETARSRAALRDQLLRAHLETANGPGCRGFGRILDVVSRPGETRRSEDFEQHLAECPYCTRTLELLRALEKYPRTALAEGLLVWGGAAFAAARLAPDAAGQEPVAPAEPESAASTAPPPTLFVPSSPSSETVSHAAARPPRSPVMTVLFAAAAVASAAVAVYFFATAGSSPAPRPHHMADVALPSRTPAVANSSLPGPAAPTQTSAAASPDPAQSTTPTPVQGAQNPTPVVYTGMFKTLINVGSGLCLDLSSPTPNNGDDVVTATCDGSRTQQWLFTYNGMLQNGAAPSLCLDERGSTDRGAGVWSCSVISGANGVFIIDSASRIRPLVAPNYAISSDPRTQGNSVSFQQVGTDNTQRWLNG